MPVAASRRLCLLLALLLAGLAGRPWSPPGAAAQAPADYQRALRFRHFSAAEGLANNHVEAVAFDRQGFAWIGTWDGLSRYDGHSVTTYRNNPLDPASLSSNVISAILEDRQGALWVATRDAGLNRFDPATGGFARFLQEGGGNRAIHSLAQDQAGALWLGRENGGLARLDPATGQATLFQPAGREPSGNQPALRGPVWDLWVDPAGAVWLAGGAVARFEPASATLTVYGIGEKTTAKLEPRAADQPPGAPPGGPAGPPPGGNPPGGPPADQPPGGAPNPPANDGQQLPAGPNADPDLLNARDFYADGEGRLWVAGNGLYLFDPAADALSRDLAGIPSQLNAVTGGAGGLWLGSLDGLYGFDPAAKTVTERQRRNPAFADSLAADAILCLETDAEGVIWAGTVDGGVDLLDLRQAQFDFYRDDPLSDNQFAGRQFGALIEDPGDPDLLWVTSGPVMHRFNRRTGEIKRYGAAGGAGVGPPEAGNISTLLRDEQGMLWFDGLDGAYRLDPATGEMERFRPDGAASFTVWALAPDGGGGLWASAVGGGLYRFDPATGQFANVLSGRDPSGLGFNDIRALHLAKDGALWLGTADGVGRYDPASGAVTAYRRQPGGPENAPSGWTNDIHQAADGRIWAGTSDGLFGFDPASGRWTRYAENEGLPARAIVGIEEDARGDLWLGTVSGLARFSPGSGAVRGFKRADGLQGDEFRPYSHYRSPSGEIWFGGVNGLTAFVPEAIADSPFQPPVALTSLQLAGKEVAPGPQSPLSAPIWQTSRLELRHDQDIVTFEFAALSYGAPGQLRYRFMLDGFESGWNEVGSDRRFATYTNLPAGDYVFRVRGSNRDGVWSDGEATLALTVLPPWWETLWFRGLALALLIGALAAGVRWRLYAVQQRNRQLEREVSARTGELVATNGLLREARDDADRARLAAEEANQAKSVFLANMSHELRSPLNAILGFAQVMGRSAQLDAEQREHVGIIRRSGEHLLALINQVLDLSKIEANRMALHERDLDLHQLLDDLEDMFALRAEEKKLQLLFERDPATPRYVRGDDLKLRQVLINLLNNAIKFTEEGGVALRIAPLEAGKDPGACRLRFEIEDTGPGIAAEEQSTLFEAFTQTASGRQAQEGTGLGLPISRRFVQLMGGDIQVRSDLGRGSVFSFEIDAGLASAGDLATRPSRRQVTGLAPGQERPRILVADDKWNNRQLLIRLLAPLGFEVREAEDGLQAVELWEEWEPHLIWMDMRMPRLSGYDAATRIKSTTKGQAVVIVALTASTLEEERAMVLSAGCDEFLRKPFRENDIFEIMEKHLGLRYLYNDQPAAEPGTGAPAPVAAADLASLPAAWRADLRQAVTALDLDRMLALIETIRPQRPALADALAAMINAFAYEPLSALLDQAEKQAAHAE